ncbi:MAG: sulfite exporter TauE/SafE family protein [Candidatus Entotheonellia bacterium]
MSAEHWYLLPVGFGIAVLAMSSGISAGNFWVPVYLLWARFEPPLAFWMTLATMLCGYGSGVARNLRQGTIDRGVIIQYLPITVPAALVGGYLGPALNVSWLILLFGMFGLGYGVWMFVQATQSIGQSGSGALPNSPKSGSLPLVREDSGGRDPQPSPTRGEGVKACLGTAIQRYGIGLLGGILVGLITVGLGELALPRLLTERKSLSPAEIVGSTVLVIFVTSLAAALVRLNGPFLAALNEQRATLLGALLFAGPGVLLGGQLGPMMARHLDARALRWYAAILLLLVSLLMLLRFTALVAFNR